MYQQRQKFQNLLLMIIDTVCLVVRLSVCGFFRLKFRPNSRNLSINDAIGNL